MRKAQKQEILDCINSLHQAHIEIREALERRDKASVQNMLSECQEFAVSIGEGIEREEGEGHVTVSFLEEYCDMLYHIYSELESGRVNAYKNYKALRQQLLKAENSVKNDISARQEVVFLPYKASMWDSLESVWMAADADPDCDAYVIPIPYYDRDSDGIFKEMHYEGNEYPPNVPVVWYEDYDFEKRKPDMIFIHNPYDDRNRITSVKPFFYSDNLKKFTERLVYIPYFLLEEPKPENDGMSEEIKDFCLYPGVYNADKVIVQSEGMRQAYIKVLTETAGEETRAYWEKRILGLGSPKIDKVLNTRKEDLDIPEEWLKIIEKPDGSWKKVILYNTSVGGLLRYKEQMLIKMQDVFRIFYENRDEVVLLWRPHPLIKATIESMRPRLWAEYKDIVAKYQSEGWGIYDDTADMNRAVALSDAYYGDMSSIVQLYQKIEKPIMLQTIHSTQEKNNQIAFSTIVKRKNEWWFFSAKSNMICKMDKGSFKVVPVAMIPFEWKTVEYRDMYIYNDKIFVIPFANSQVKVYDIENDSFREIDVPVEKRWRGNPFSEGVTIEDKLYLLPQAFNKLIYVDMADENIHEIIENIDDKSDISDIYFSRGCIKSETCELLMGKALKNEFTYMNMTNIKKESYFIEGIISDGWGDIKESENGIWYVPYTVDRIFFEKKNEKGVYEYSNFPENYVADKCSFIKTFVYKDKLFLIPRSANMLLVIDERGNVYAPLGIEEKWDDNSYYEKAMRYSDIWEDDGKLYIFSSIRGEIIELTNCEKPIYRDVDFSLVDNWCVEKDMSFTYGEEKESDLGNISFLIRHILQEKVNIALRTDVKKEVGTKIYFRCKFDVGE